jgi:hypothetical protein
MYLFDKYKFKEITFRRINMTLQKFNKQLHILESDLSLIKGKGYFYFISKDIYKKVPDSIYVNSIEQLTSLDVYDSIEEYRELNKEAIK